MPPPPPRFALALPHSNSLPASLEILARLGQTARPGRIVVAGRGDWRRDLALAVRQSGLAVFMRQAHIGLFGGAASWLAASSSDPGTVRRTWGPEVVTIPLSEVAERYRTRAASSRERAGGAVATTGGDAGATPDESGRFRRAVAGVVEPDDATIGGAVDLYWVLQELATVYRLDALTVRCFNLLGDLGNTACYALSRLNDEGLTADYCTMSQPRAGGERPLPRNA